MHFQIFVYRITVKPFIICLPPFSYALLLLIFKYINIIIKYTEVRICVWTIVGLKWCKLFYKHWFLNRILFFPITIYIFYYYTRIHKNYTLLRVSTKHFFLYLTNVLSRHEKKSSDVWEDAKWIKQTTGKKKSILIRKFLNTLFILLQ